MPIPKEKPKPFKLGKLTPNVPSKEPQRGSAGGLQPLKFTSQQIPAGSSLPIRIKPGTNKITILNPNNGTGVVTFPINGVPNLRNYTQGIPDNGGDYDFFDPSEGPYLFTNPLGPASVTVQVDVDFIGV